MLTTRMIAKIATITPKTCQPLPRTSSRLRPSAAKTPGFSTTTTGEDTAQIVRMMRPGTMNRISPTTTEMPTTNPTRISGTMTRGDRAEQLADAGVHLPVLHVLHRAHDHARVPGGRHQPDEARDEPPGGAVVEQRQRSARRA